MTITGIYRGHGEWSAKKGGIPQILHKHLSFRHSVHLIEFHFKSWLTGLIKCIEGTMPTDS